MASSKHRAKELLLQQKMSKQSNVSAFDVSRLFKSATNTERTSMQTLRYKHTKLSETVAEALSRTSDYQCCTEEDLEVAFGPRKRSACSEPYFWEQCYRVLNSTEVVPIDVNGQARVFVMLQQNKKMRHENCYEDNLPTYAVRTAGVTGDAVPSSMEIPAQQQESLVMQCQAPRRYQHRQQESLVIRCQAIRLMHLHR